MEMAIMPLAMVEDLLIVARERVVVPRLDGTAARLEIRLESRRTERRRASDSLANAERRQGDRRTVDVGEQLRERGWVFLSAARRRAIAHDSRLPSRRATAPDPDQGTADDEPVIEGSLADTSLCAPCIAMTCNIPFFRVERALEHLKGSPRIRVLSARCEGCWKTTVVYARGLAREIGPE
jgi:hypothetical protein